jgi:hypothetical protein
MLRDGIGELRSGDRIVMDGHRVGGFARRGRVDGVLGKPRHERCCVRWDDRHQTLVYLGADIRIERAVPSGPQAVEWHVDVRRVSGCSGAPGQFS